MLQQGTRTASAEEASGRLYYLMDGNADGNFQADDECADCVSAKNLAMFVKGYSIGSRITKEQSLLSVMGYEFGVPALEQLRDVATMTNNLEWPGDEREYGSSEVVDGGIYRSTGKVIEGEFRQGQQA